MKKICYVLILFLLTLFACKKDDSSYTVSYRIIRTTLNVGPYYVRYSLPDGTLKTEGPITTEGWMTADLVGYKKNTIVSLYLDADQDTYEMIIYINGEAGAHLNAQGGIGEQVLDAQIPN